jgi:two-component system, sensor histidine kinase
LGGVINSICVWGVYASLPLASGMIVLLTLLGAFAVALMFLSLVRFGVAVYILPAFIIMMYLSLFNADTQSIPLAFVLPVYLIINFRASLDNRASVREGIWQRFQLEANSTALELARIEAESGNRAKSQFLANMSHEIRTPMNGMLGSLDLIEDGNLTAHQKRWLEMARSSGNALLAVINDVLDYSKMEVGMQVFLKEPFDLHATIYNAATTLAATAKRKNIVLAVNVEADVPQYVLGDRVKLGQVLLNLIGNAVKFTDNGAVTVRASVVRNDRSMHTVGDRKERICIDVVDTGIGIASEHLGQIFAPFHQVDASDTRHYQGAGLGLAIVKQLVTGMGGETRVSSGLHKGSMFSIVLPLNIASAPAVSNETSELIVIEPAPMQKQQLTLVADANAALQVKAQGNAAVGAQQPYRVLIAEDNAINLMVLLRILERLDIIADEASDGEDALKKWQQQHYDAILMDCQMPKMDGFEATQSIRAIEQTTGRARTPIIAITANALSSDRDKCLNVGMDGYLAKPFRIDDLQATLKQYLPAISSSIHSASD